MTGLREVIDYILLFIAGMILFIAKVAVFAIACIVAGFLFRSGMNVADKNKGKRK